MASSRSAPASPRPSPPFDEHDLALAIAEGGIEVDYQGRVDLATHRFVGVEALARWRTDRGEIPPDRFIPVAEKSGLICDLSRWIIDRACRDVVGFEQDMERPVRLSVNIAPAQLRGDVLVEDLQTALRTSGYDARRLELEITERQSVTRNRDTVWRIEGLRALGIAIALDDFGTGRSNASYLSWLSVDTIKIDRCFIGAIGTRRVPELDRMIALAHQAGSTVVGEGVETRLQLDYLRKRGCDQAQGFLFGPAVRVGHVVDMLTRRPPGLGQSAASVWS